MYIGIIPPAGGSLPTFLLSCRGTSCSCERDVVRSGREWEIIRAGEAASAASAPRLARLQGNKPPSVSPWNGKALRNVKVVLRHVKVVLRHVKVSLVTT